MKMTLRLSACALAAMIVAASSASAATTDASLATKCKAVKSCKLGGQSDTCTVGQQECPPCMAFDNNACYVKVDGACPFFAKDCEAYFSLAAGGSGSGSGKGTNSSGNGKVKPAGSKHGSAAGAGETGHANGTDANATKAPATNETTANSTGKSSSGSEMSIVFGIIGAAIGVIAVAVIFLVLVRRSRAANDEDDELATPQAVNKGAGPATTTNATYAPYAQRSGTNPTTPTNRVIKYYNDNALPSPQTRHAGGGFNHGGPAAQQPTKVVRPAAAGNAPTFFKNPAAASMPVAAAAPAAPQQQYEQYEQYVAAPLQPQPQQQQQQTYAPQQTYSAAPAPPTVTVSAMHHQQQQQQHEEFVVQQDVPVARKASSPRPRRESYEF
ncbi:hypothetical protein PINS_up018741 [Pythium insidiosum]|nr:hypothetical protein PINS_up018741 [Pythium insidiosum]